MKNVTITVEDDALEWARIEAARRNSSVSRLVGDMLRDKMQQNDAYAKARAHALAFEALSFQGDYLPRDGIYAERLQRFR